MTSLYRRWFQFVGMALMAFTLTAVVPSQALAVDLDLDGIDDLGSPIGCNGDGDDLDPNVPVGGGNGNSDADSLTDGQELFCFGTNAGNSDTDGDGLNDDAEVIVYGTDPNSSDTDGDLMPDGWEVSYGLDPLVDDANGDLEGDGLNNVGEYLLGADPTNSDSDGDGMTDGWEVANSLNPAINDAAGDAEPDGLDNLGEFTAGTDPNVSDTDGDGLNDGNEVNVYGTDPLADADFDGDGIDDDVEILVLGTNHAAQDTDGDGLTDDYETGYGDANVNDYDVGTDLDPNFEDTDGDGMCDGSSQIAGCVGAEGTLGSNPLDVDSDNDGVCDGDGTEAACLALPSVLGENNLGTDPNDADTDDDGLADDVDSDPLDADADDDGLIDGTDDANSCYGVNDCDSDGLLDGVEYGVDTGSAPAAGNSPSGIAFAGSSGYSGDVDTGSTTDLNDDDSDDDGILDGTEDANGNGGVGITETDPNDVDTDSNDGLCDGAGAAAGCLVYNGGYGELDYGTDPLDSDTDGDTLTDGYGEVAALGGASTDPFDIDTDQDGWNDDLDTNNFDADQDDDGLADGADNAIGCVNSYDCDGDSLSDGLESGIATAAAPAGGNSTNSIAFAGTAGGYVGDADTGSTTNPNSNDTDSDGASDGREDTNGNGQVNAPEGNPNVDDAITLGGTISGINTWCPWGCDWLEVYLESPVGTVRANTLFTTTNGGYSTYNALDQVAITGQSYNVSVQYFNANWWTIVCGVSNATGVAGVSDINNIDILCTGYSDVNVYMHAPEWWDYNNINVYVSSDLFPPQVFTLSDGWNATYYANDLASISITTSVSGADRCIFEDGTTNRYTAPFNFGYGDHDVHLTCGTAVDLNVDLVNVQNAGQSTDVWASSDNWWLNWGTQTMNDGSPIATFTMVEGVNYYLGHNLYSAPVPQAQSCVFKRDNDPTQSWDGSSIDTWDDTWGVGSAINATLTCDETELYTVVLNLEAGSTDADIYLHTATGLWDTVAIYGADESDNGTTLMEVPMIPAASYFTTAFGSVCSTRYDGLIAYVTCGYEYAIGGKVMGSAGLAGDTVTLSLTSNNDSTVHLATLPADNIAGEGFNFAVDPATYVVQGSQWEVLVDTQPTTVGSFCSVSNGTGTATGSMAAPWLVTNTTVTCGLLRTITVEVTAQTGFDVDVALASSLGATQTQNNIMNGGSTTFQVVDGAVIDVTVADYNNHSAYCTVVGGTAVTVSGDLTVFINCGSTYTILGGAISNLTGSGLELRETNTGATAVPVGASYAFPQNILQTGAAYNVVISRQPTAPDQVCTLSGTTNGTVANQNVQGPDVDCNIVLPWYNLAVNVSGLAGDRVRLIEVAGSQVTNATADGLVTFARSVTNGTYTVQVDQQPAGPQQQCRFNNTGTTSETVVISNADATVNLTCFTVPQYSLSVNVSGLAGDRVRLIETVSGQVTNVVVDGVATFPTALTNGAYTVQVDVQPYGPAQTCRFDNTGTTSETVVIANASVAIDLTCVDNVYTVSALVEGKDDLAGDLVLNYNGVTYPVTTDTQVTFGSEIQGTPYLVTVETQPALPAQTCEVDRGLGMVGTSAVSDVAVTCTDDLFTVYANVSGLALGSSLLLSNNGDPMIVEGDGVWAFPAQLTGVGAYDVVVLDESSFQTCVVSSAPSTGNLADADVTVDITCTTDAWYSLSVNVSGLAGDRVRLIEVASGQVTNVTADGVATFASDLTNGTYTVQVDVNPDAPVQTCTFDNTGTAAETVVIANASQTLNLTCVDNLYAVWMTVNGLNGDQVDVDFGSYQGDLSTMTTTSSGIYTIGNYADQTTFAARVVRQPVLPAQTCTVTPDLFVVDAGTPSGLTVNCVDDKFAVSANVTGLALGSSLRLSNNSEPMIVTGNGVWPFPTRLSGTDAYNVQVQEDSSWQTCVVSSAPASGNLADASVTVDITCTTDPLYSLTVNVGGLNGDRVRMVETTSGSEVNAIVDGAVVFSNTLTNGTYTVQVDAQPFGPAQTCRFDNTGTTSETVVIANANEAIDLTCVDNVYSVSALVEGKDDLAGDLVLNYNGVTYPVTTDTQVTFGSEIQGTPYLVTVETQPALPAQTCEVQGGLGMVGTTPVSDVAVTCTDNLYAVYANVSGLELGSSLLLSNNGDPMIVEGDGIWAFPVQLTGVGIYDVVMVDDTSFQTCVVSSAPSAGYLADADVTVDITCTDDQFYTIGVNVIGLAGDRVRLIEVASNQVTNAVASGVVTFATDLTNGTYTVQVDAQPNDENPNVTNYAHQVCLFDNGTTSRVVTLNNTNQVINLTCTTVTYTVSGNVRGLRTTGPSAPYTLTLTNNGGNAQVRSVNGAFTFTTQLAEGVAYNVAVSVQPVNQHCTVLNGSGVIGQSNANSVEVVCEHTDFDLDGIPDEQERNVYGTATDTTDSDGDGLNDYFETQTATTNPLTDDTDHDGALDADELAGYGAALTTDPLDRDTDNDGLTDGFEVGYGGNAAVYTAGVDLNPLDIDTDDGGIGDGVEVDSGNYVLFPATNPLVAADDILDTDGDSIPDIVEYNGASYFWGYRTNHLNPDSDNDGLSDAEEIYGYSTNALSDDSDGDGVSDVLEVETYNSNPLSTDTDGDNLSDWNEIFSYSTSPIENDTDQDGARDDYEVNGYGAGRQTNPLEVDTDHDGLYDGYEVSYCDSDPSDYDGGCDLDPTDPDTDDGGVKDGVEVNSGNTVLFPSTDPLNSLDDTLDSDLDGIPDIIEYNGASMAWGYQTDHRQSDTDHDGLSDSVEIYGYGTSAIDTDSDDDGLTDYVEVTVHHTNPLSVDSDNDGFTDPQEISTTRTDPKVEDTDGDGIRDYTEAMTIYTNPLIADTDADGLTDGYETARDGNAETYTAGRDYNPNVADTDDGGVSDGVEVKFDHTNPNVQRDDKIDRDNDNIYDWYEINEQGTNPEDRDTDGDGLDDGQELVLRTDLLDTDSDDDGLSDYNEVALYSSNPLTDDTDGDALSDPREINVYHTDVLVADSDRDGLTDGREVDVTRTDPLNSDSDNDRLLDGAEVDFHQTDPNHPDSDGDRIEDGDEVFHIGTDPAVADTDRDGISDGDEVLDHKTDPMDADSDNDGDSDGKEVNKLRTDPLDNDSNAIASSGAGGCSVAARGTTNNWNLLPIFAVALLVALRRKRVRLRPVMAALVAAIAVLVVSVPAQAKQLSFKPHNTQTFYMADDVGEYFVTRDSRTRKQLGFQVALGFNYSKEMLVVRENDKIKRVVIDRLLTEDTMLSFGIIDQLQLDVAVPYHVYVERGKVQNKETYKTNNWGDIRAGLKGRILDRMEYPVGLAVRGFVYTPTGREKQYLGAPGVEYGLQAIIDRDFEFLKLAANLGWVGRESSSLPGARFDDQFTWSVATDLSLSEHFGLIVDVFGATVLKDFFKIEYGSPIEGAVGGRYWLDNGFTMSAGLGRGVNSGAGAPPMRMNWEMAYQLPNDRDRDMDGFSDELDTCAGRAEDVDGYRDSDGCPDRDHDEDGVLDAGDSCPTVAEDRDGFDDRDGCPEFDNDGDGILDEVDRCPNAKETVNGYADGDGCPDAERISVQATIIDDESGAKLAGEITVDPKVGKVRFEKGTWKGDLPEPGVYSFTFKVQGYESVYRKFQVTAGQKLTMEIRMLMAESDDEAPSAPKAQPAPAAAPKAEPAQPAETAPATVQPEAN